MRRTILALLTLCMLILTGCYDAVDLNEQIFAVNLALDEGENAPLLLTLQVPQIVPTGKEPAQTDSDLQKNGYVLQQVEGHTLKDCLQLMHMVTPRRLSLMQMRGIYISENIAKDSALLQDCLAVLSDAHIVRPAAVACITRGRAEDVLKAQLPLFGARLSKAQEAQSNALQKQGIIPSAPLKRFAAAFGSSTGAIAVLCAVNNAQLDQSGSDIGSLPAAHLAGELPRRTADTVDLCGSALIGRNGPLYLDGYETQLINLLRGEIKALTLARAAERVRIELCRKPHICVSPQADTPRIEIRLPVRVHAADSVPYAEALYEDILTLLLKLQQSGVDPIGFADRAKMSVLTEAQWEMLDWETLYAQAIWEINGAS